MEEFCSTRAWFVDYHEQEDGNDDVLEINQTISSANRRELEVVLRVVWNYTRSQIDLLFDEYYIPQLTRLVQRKIRNYNKMCF